MRKLWELIWVPERNGDILLAARERMLNVVALAVVVFGGLAGFLHLLENIDTYPVQSLLGFIVPLFAVLIPLIARNPRHTRIAGIVLCVGLYLLVTGVISTIGGMAHPAAIYLAGLPLTVTLLIGHRAGLVSAVVASVTMATLFALGDHIPNPFADEITRYATGWNTTVLIILTLGIAVAAGIFQHELEGAGRALERARERAHAASRAKSDFLASISHEIRTPMNAILGMAQALEASGLPDAQRQQAETLARSGRLLLRLVNDVLDLSKIEAGKLEIEATRFSLVDTADTVQALYGPAAREKGIALEIVLTDAARAPMTGDPVRISQILNNLVSNAIKFTAAGSVNVTIDSLETHEETGRKIRVQVRDTGIGITPEQASDLFQPFVQADIATARNFGGTGLGLTICRRLCELMDGDIELDSRPGEGTTFTAHFHVRIADEQAARIDATAISPAEAIRMRARPLRVLAADDNLTNRLVLQALLADAGCELVLVEDGQQALEALSTEAFDIALLDSQMPVLDGTATAQRIRERERATGQSPLPIYAVTANVMADHMQAYKAAGMNGVIAKPVGRDMLLATLARHAGERPADDTASSSARSA